MVEVVKYLRQYFKPSDSAVDVSFASYERDGARHRAAVYRPAGKRGRLPAWVVLHGLTYRGLLHPSLVRFASSLAASGHVVFIPEIMEWTQLHVAPSLTPPTIRASVDALSARGDVDPERIGVFAFSFGATQSLIAATDENLASRVRAIVAWGGFADTGRLTRFGFTGEHEIDGVLERLVPDPYGRWIIGANYLTSIPGYENMTDAANALMTLAREAGKSGVFAGDPVHHRLNAALAHSLDPRQREVFNVFAPIDMHDLDAEREMAQRIADVVVAKDPLMDPARYLADVRVPTLIAHGRDDRLIPYTESIQLARRLPPKILLESTITSLFSHSGGTEPGLGAFGLAREGRRFAAVLNRILTTL
jgi:pimeloyl-ACP methyl ester carboxylesterase